MLIRNFRILNIRNPWILTIYFCYRGGSDASSAESVAAGDQNTSAPKDNKDDNAASDAKSHTSKGGGASTNASLPQHVMTTAAASAARDSTVTAHTNRGGNLHDLYGFCTRWKLLKSVALVSKDANSPPSKEDLERVVTADPTADTILAQDNPLFDVLAVLKPEEIGDEAIDSTRAASHWSMIKAHLTDNASNITETALTNDKGHALTHRLIAFVIKENAREAFQEYAVHVNESDPYSKCTFESTLQGKDQDKTWTAMNATYNFLNEELPAIDWVPRTLFKPHKGQTHFLFERSPAAGDSPSIRNSIRDDASASRDGRRAARNDGRRLFGEDDDDGKEAVPSAGKKGGGDENDSEDEEDEGGSEKGEKDGGSDDDDDDEDMENENKSENEEDEEGSERSERDGESDDDDEDMEDETSNAAVRAHISNVALECSKVARPLTKFDKKRLLMPGEDIDDIGQREVEERFAQLRNAVTAMKKGKEYDYDKDEALGAHLTKLAKAHKGKTQRLLEIHFDMKRLILQGEDAEEVDEEELKTRYRTLMTIAADLLTGGNEDSDSHDDDEEKDAGHTFVMPPQNMSHENVVDAHITKLAKKLYEDDESVAWDDYDINKLEMNVDILQDCDHLERGTELAKRFDILRDRFEKVKAEEKQK